MDPFLRSTPTRPPFRLKPILWVLVAIALLIGTGWLLARWQDRQEQKEVADTTLDTLVVALRENRNRLEVHRLSGTVTTKQRNLCCAVNIVTAGPPSSGPIRNGNVKVEIESRIDL